ncbi:hypothetical protein [Bradyrhizobium sp. USDA 3364]
MEEPINLNKPPMTGACATAGGQARGRRQWHRRKGAGIARWNDAEEWRGIDFLCH